MDPMPGYGVAPAFEQVNTKLKCFRFLVKINIDFFQIQNSTFLKFSQRDGKI